MPDVRLPKRVVLPFGYIVRVVLTTNKKIKELNGGTVTDGLFDPETRTIYIRQALGGKRRRYILGHELDHAINDWRHWCGDQGIAAQ